MPYVLGLDMGSTTTTAAISRLRGRRWAAPEVVQLGARSPGVPSVLQLAADGSFTVGDSGVTDSGRVVRGFTRRIGDDVPMLVGGEPCTPQTLTAVLAMWVVERVQAQEGEHPDLIVLAHPAHWGPYRKKALHDALRAIGLLDVALLPAPVVAAESHAADGWSGGTLGVYALGGNGYDAAVVRRTEPMGFDVLGSMAGVEPLGGADFDEALATHVRGRLGEAMRRPDPGDPQLRLALFGLRHECARAKEKLTAAAETELVIRLPQGREERITVTRAEFAELIRPAVQVTVDNLVRAVHSCGLRPRQLDGVLLVGGSARIPLVADLVAAEFPDAVVTPPDPQTAVAAGAALAARQLLTGQPLPRAARTGTRAPGRDLVPVVPPTVPAPPSRAVSVPPDDDLADGPENGPPPRPPVVVSPLRLPRPRLPSGLGKLRGRGIAPFGALGALVIVVGIMLPLGPTPGTPDQATSIGASIAGDGPR